jgi:hypothetical protein
MFPYPKTNECNYKYLIKLFAKKNKSDFHQSTDYLWI